MTHIGTEKERAEFLKANIRGPFDEALSHREREIAFSAWQAARRDPVETLSADIKESQKFTGDSEMRRTFEIEYGQSWTDPEWRKETGIWASAWYKATASAQFAAVQQGVPADALIENVMQRIRLLPQTGSIGEMQIKAILIKMQGKATHPTQQGLGHDMVSVKKEDANNYCGILSALGMEEEGDPVAEVKRLIAATQQGLDAPTLDDAWEARLLDGRELDRDEYGFGFHPELPEVQESTDVCKFFELFGIEVQCVSADEDLDCEEYDRMSGIDPEGPFNFTDWKPGAPDGEGWKLVSIHDTEDGPYAMWLRALTAQAKHVGV